jgi:hypothetical protein
MSSENLVGGDAEHPASGTVKVEDNSVKLIDVKISDAPDGCVILTKDLKEENGVRLGALQAFDGSHEYAIPPGVNVADYNSVLIWCDQFNVPIGKANL